MPAFEAEADAGMARHRAEWRKLGSPVAAGEYFWAIGGGVMKSTLAGSLI